MINSIPAESPPPPTEPVQSAERVTEPREDRWLMRGTDGTTYGPIRLEELQRWYAEGRINYQCSVQRLGSSDWQPALDVEGIRGTEVSGNYPRQTQYAPQTPGSVPSPHNGTLIIVLALAGLVFFPCAVAAAIWGYIELGHMKRGLVDRSGEGLVRAGFVIGLILTGLSLISVSCCCCLLPSVDAFR
jgi:hypothetical protein